MFFVGRSAWRQQRDSSPEGCLKCSFGSLRAGEMKSVIYLLDGEVQISLGHCRALF